MSDDIARLSIQVDATSADKASKSLSELTAQGVKAEAQAGKLGKAHQALAADTNSTVKAYENLFTGDFVSQYAAQTAAIAKTTQAYKLNQAQVQELTGVVRHSIDALASGASPLTVIAQHFSSVAEAAGTNEHGLTGTLGALSRVINPFTVGMAIAAGGLIAFGVAALMGAQEQAELQNAIRLTGNYAGVTAGQVDDMARKIATSTSTGIGKASAALETLVASGKVTGDALGYIADASVRLGNLTGESATKIAEGFAKIAGDPIKAMNELNEQYNFLTEAQYEHISALAKEGQQTEATKELFKAFDGSLADQVAHFGLLETAIHGVGNALSGLWQSMKDFGKQAPIVTQLASINAEIVRDTKAGYVVGAPAGTDLNATLKSLSDRAAKLQAQVDADSARSQQAQTSALTIKANSELEGTLTGLKSNVERAKQEMAKYRTDAQSILKDSKAGPEAIANANYALSHTSQLDAEINKRYAGGTGSHRTPTDNNAVALDAAQKAQLAAQLPLTADVQEIAGIKHDEVAAELKLETDRLAKQVHEKTITEATADLAGSAYKAAADAKDELINRQAASALIQQELTQRKALGSDLDAIASIQASMAGTAEEANKIELDALAARQKLAHDELAASTNDLVIAKKITDVQQVQLLVSQAKLQAAQTAKAEQDAQIKVIHEQAGIEQAGLERVRGVAEAQASLLRSTYARAVAEKGILESAQAEELSKAREALAVAQAANNAEAIAKAESNLDIIKARQAADKKLLERETSLIHGIQDATDAAGSLKDALARHDWASLFDDFQRTIESIKAAFTANGVAGGVLSAGSVVASLIGGKTGKALGTGIGVAGLGLTAGGALIDASLGAAQAGTISSGLAGLGVQIGSLLGPIGIIAGIGVTLASLLKSKPSNNAAIASISGTSGFAISGDKQTSETAQAATSAANAVLQGEQLLQAAGIKLATTVTKIDIGTRDLTHVFLSTGEELRTAIGDPAAAAEAGLKAVLQGATYTSDAEKKLVDSLVAAGKGFDDIATALQNYAAAQQVSASIANQILQLQDPKAFDLKAVSDAIDAQKASALAMETAGYLTADDLTKINGQLDTLEGLQIDAVMKRYGDAVTAATDIMKVANDNVDAERQKAQAIYDAQVSAYQEIITKAQAAADSLGKFRDSLTNGALAGLSPTAQLASTRAQFNSLAALPAGDQTRLDGLQAASEAFLAADKAAAPSQLAYYRDLAAVRRATDASAKAAAQQVSDAQHQLDALNELVKGQLDIASAVTAGAGDIVAALASLSAAEQVVSNLLITQAAQAAAAATAAQVAQATPDTPAAPVNDNSALTAPTFTTPAIDTAAIVAAVANLQVQMVSVQTSIDAQTKTLLAPAKKTADTLVRVSRDGESLQTVAA